jgi:hypothetical protein
MYLKNLLCGYYDRCIGSYKIRNKKENTLIRPLNHLESCTFTAELSKSMQRPNRSPDRVKINDPELKLQQVQGRGI